MMKTLKLQLLAGLFLGALALAGCKDECKDVTCVQGACVDGNCVCDAGYSGADCSVAANARFNGTYNLSEVCSVTGSKTYSVPVAPVATSPLKATFTFLWQSPQDVVTADVASDGNTFSIPKQDLGNSGYDLESTSGTISADGKTITLAYRIYIDDTSFIESCTATLTR